MEKTKVAAYCRVSTNTEDQKNSFEAQKRYFEEQAENNKQYEIVEIYADEGISGLSLKKRDSFLKMIYDAGVDFEKRKKGYEFDDDNDREPKFKKILIKDISRFSRNTNINMLYRCLISKGVSLVLVNQGLELSKVSDEFYLNLLLNFAQQESVDKSEKVRWGLQQSAKNGVIKFARDLYGYNYDPETKEISIVEEEAAVVRSIYDMYINKDMGFRRIAIHLEELNVRTRDGNRFGESTLARMVSNRKYCGDLVYFKYDSGEVLDKNTTYKVRPEQDWIVHEDVIPPIISKEMFDKAQGKKQSRMMKNRGKKNPHTIYSKLLICGNCGAFYGRNKANGKYLMNCMTKKRFGVKRCDYPNIGVDEFENILDNLARESIYNSILYLKNEKKELLEEMRLKLIGKMKNNIPVDLSEKYLKLEQAKEQKNKLIDLYLSDAFDKNVLDQKESNISSLIESLENEIKELSMPIDEIQKQIEEINQSLIDIDKVKFKSVFTREDVLNILDNVEVEHVWKAIHLKFNFKIDQTINHIIDESIPEFSEFRLPSTIVTIRVARNVPARPPKVMHKLREDVDVEEHIKTIEERMRTAADKYKRLTEN